MSPRPQSATTTPLRPHRQHPPLRVTPLLCGVLLLHPLYKSCTASSAYLKSAQHSWCGPVTPSCLGGWGVKGRTPASSSVPSHQALPVGDTRTGGCQGPGATPLLDHPQSFIPWMSCPWQTGAQCVPVSHMQPQRTDPCVPKRVVSPHCV